VSGSQVFESFKSYKELKAKYDKGELEDKPRLPNYRTSCGMAVVSYPKQHLKQIDDSIKIPLGQTVKRWFGIDSFYIPMPTNIDFQQIKEVRILPRNRHSYIEFVYSVELQAPQLDISQALGIDPGLSNWLTCVSTLGQSFIIDGLHLKSMNQWYNKTVSRLQELGLLGSKRFYSAVEKRNRQMRDAINNAARIVVNHCLDNGIGTIVFGWNKGQKQEANLGKVNNQKFVQIPTAKLKKRIQQLAEQYGIRFEETEESYTSKASFLDGDLLPTFGESNTPVGWQPSGKRIKRGLFKTAKNWLVSADAQAAANILKKVATTLGLDLVRVGRGTLTTPARIKLWNTHHQFTSETKSIPVP
jgi:IS605 OrfB family transposase